MSDDQELKWRIIAEDEYSDKIEQASEATERLDKAQERAEESTVEANLAFQAEIQALDAVHGGMMKVIGAVQELELANDEQLKMMRKVAAVLDLVTGAYQAAIAVRQLDILSKLKHIAISQAQAAALLGVAAAAGGVAMAMMAMNAKTDEARALYSVLTGVTWALAAAEFALAIAKITGATLGFGTIAAVALVAGSLAAIATYVAATQAQTSAETGPGEVKRVTRTGEVTVHEGEVIHRGGAPGNTIHVHIRGDAGDLSKKANRRKFEQMLARALAEVM